MRLDLASVLVQWAAGGLFFCWVTTRRRVVGVGYGWLVRSVYAAVAVGGVAAGVVASDAGTATAIRDGADASASKVHHVMTVLLPHLSHLAIAALADHDLQQ